jgi:hypothetical protein
LGSHPDALDELMQMVGLENMKNWLVSVNALIKFGKQQKATSKFNPSLTFVGNPGTGMFSHKRFPSLGEWFTKLK